MIPTFYFAHATTMYDTRAEAQVAERFRRARPGTEVENPNQARHSEGYQREGMDYFVRLCNGLDGVFFTPMADGTVGAGVAKEVQSFLDRGAPTLYFDPMNGDFVQISDRRALESMRVRDVDGTRARLKEERGQKAAGQDPYADLGTFSESVRRHQVDILA